MVDKKTKEEVNMDKYYGLDVNELYGVKDALTCWILYQISEEQGKKVRLWSNKGPLFSILNVRPGSLKYIVYESGEKYLFEDLEKYEDSGKIDLDKTLFEKELGVIRQDQGMLRAWQKPTEWGLTEMLANKNGFCKVIHKTAILQNGKMRTKEDLAVTVDISIRSNAKKLYKKYVENINCHCNVNPDKFDYEQFCVELLSDKNLELNYEESISLIKKMNEICSDFHLYDGGFSAVGKYKSGSKIEHWIQVGNKKSVIREDRWEEVFASWLKGKDPEKLLNTILMLGLCE